MTKCKHNFDKDELERLYKEYGNYRLAAKALGVSKTTFMQQYRKSKGQCIICAQGIPEEHKSYTCQDCLEKNRVEDKPSTKLCLTCGVTTLHRLEGQCKVSWTKKQDCEECLKEKYKISAKKTYLKFRPRNLANDKLDPRVKEYQKAYRSSEHGKQVRRVSNSRRRAVKVTTASPTIDTYIHFLHSKTDSKCPYCPSTDNLSIDHILPLSRGGTHTEDNVELVCLPCNIRKGTKTKEEFIEFLKDIKEN